MARRSVCSVPSARLLDCAPPPFSAGARGHHHRQHAGIAARVDKLTLAATTRGALRARVICRAFRPHRVLGNHICCHIYITWGCILNCERCVGCHKREQGRSSSKEWGCILNCEKEKTKKIWPVPGRYPNTRQSRKALARPISTC